MSLPNTGITISQVQTELNEGTYDLGSLCKSDNVNKYSKHKPVSYPFETRKALSFEQLMKTTNYGLNAAQMSATTPSQCYSKAVSNSHTIQYVKPTGGASSPYSLGDFRGYSHQAASPFPEIEANDNFVEMQFNTNAEIDIEDMPVASKPDGYVWVPVAIESNGNVYPATIPFDENTVEYTAKDRGSTYDTSGATVSLTLYNNTKKSKTFTVTVDWQASGYYYPEMTADSINATKTELVEVAGKSNVSRTITVTETDDNIVNRYDPQYTVTVEVDGKSIPLEANVDSDISTATIVDIAQEYGNSSNGVYRCRFPSSTASSRNFICALAQVSGSGISSYGSKWLWLPDSQFTVPKVESANKNISFAYVYYELDYTVSNGSKLVDTVYASIYFTNLLSSRNVQAFAWAYDKTKTSNSTYGSTNSGTMTQTLGTSNNSQVIRVSFVLQTPVKAENLHLMYGYSFQDKDSNTVTMMTGDGGEAIEHI